MTKKCELRAANGRPGEACDTGECIFWRVVEHLDVGQDVDGCAIQHYQLLGNEEVAQWLLSVKERLERSESAAGEGEGGPR